MLNDLVKLMSLPLIEVLTKGMKQHAEQLVLQRRMIEVLSERCNDPTILEQYDSEFTKTIDIYNERFETMTLDELQAYMTHKLEIMKGDLK